MDDTVFDPVIIGGLADSGDSTGRAVLSFYFCSRWQQRQQYYPFD